MEQVIEGVRRLLPNALQRVLPFLQEADDADSSYTARTAEPAQEAPDSSGLQRAPRRYFDALAKALPDLPPEVMIQILSEAGLYARYVMPRSGKVAVDQRSSYRIVAQTPPLSSYGAGMLRQIILRFASHDQGYSGEPRALWGTYACSHTWFEVALARQGQGGETLRPTEEPLRRLEIQRNRHASHDFEEYTITLDTNHALLAQVEEGDSVVLLACAQYPAWRNYVDWASVELAWTDTFDEVQPMVFLETQAPVAAELESVPS